MRAVIDDHLEFYEYSDDDCKNDNKVMKQLWGI